MKAASLFGHRAAQSQLIRAIHNGRLPQVMLLTGEPGVGKQSLGRWLAALLLCEQATDQPCHSCYGCRLMSKLAHPDFHWLVPILRPKASDPDKQIDEAKEAIDEAMAARRDAPVYAPPEGLASHGVASARLILRMASRTPAMGGRQVFVIGDADRLVPQASSPEAANTILKFLEEPPASATIVLTTTDPTRVLPTIRSRAVPVRLGRLDAATIDEAVASYLPDLPAPERAARVAGADGSIGRALVSRRERAGNAAEELLTSFKQGGPAPLERALRQNAWAARGDFTTLLDDLTVTLSDAARAVALGRGALPKPLEDIDRPERLLAAIGRVDAAREAAQGNVNPQLLLATLGAELTEALWA